MSTISKATVLSVKEYGKEVREYTLKLEKNHYFEAGSFLLLTLEKKDDYTRWPESRNFSIASAYNKTGIIKLIIRQVGAYTTRIFNELQIGSECVVKYAFGDFLLPFFDKKGAICCLAGGTGIAPVLSFCEQLKEGGMQHRLHVFYSFKNEEELIDLDILKANVPVGQLHLFCTRQQMSAIPHRRIKEEDLQKGGLDYHAGHFYICGGETFTSTFKTYLENSGAENIYTDEW
ncbi:MAG: FAD-dependent oxidoreductase [Bacteroides sp.]|jgi:ferredoxin-NADP reductase|nr:FAD-dependent oxidoreductase [Bacteroides sp.]MCI1682753.1 FAD-dependent oxidoreductase [Bacteroides sp.]